MREHGRILAASLVCVAMLVASANTAAAQDAAVGARIGTNWSLLQQPLDDRGEPTLMSGTAFSGWGFTAGGWGEYHIAKLAGTLLQVEGGLLYSLHRGMGFEEETDTDARREATIRTGMLRIPILLSLRGSPTGSTFRIGAGLEPAFGFASGATVTVENTDEPPEPLYTTPVTHIGPTFLLGFDVQATEDILVPLEFRASWDPMVGQSTRDRFQNYTSSANPGDYEAAFDWQLIFSTGVTYNL